MPFNLNYKQYGNESSSPLLIAHGLFGSLDNWVTLAKQFSTDFNVYCVDLRNHGLSPHTEAFSIELLAEDLNHFIETKIGKPTAVIGHSLGGKAAMHLAINFPQSLSKLIVADIAPKAYPPHHQIILQALHSLDFTSITSRKEAEEMLFKQLKDLSTVQFLAKNIARTDDGKLKWKFNLESLTTHIAEVGKPQVGICTLSTLFLRADRSNYVLDSDVEAIQEQFPFSEINTIENAGHWLHAEQPKAFYEAVIGFLGK